MVLLQMMLLFAGIFALFVFIGMAIFESGLVRAKNAVDILVKNIAIFALTCFVFSICGWHLLAGGYSFGIYFPLIDWHWHIARDTLAFFFFHFIAAAIVMSIIAGATAERFKLWSLVIFTIIMVGFIYPVQAFWVWHGGFLQKMGFIDAAGAGVIHETGAVAALAALLLIGARQGRYKANGTILPMLGSNLPLACFGGFLIWIGFFGLNIGGAISWGQPYELNDIAAIVVNTSMAGSCGLLAAMIISRILLGTTDITILFNGAVAGLVAIAPAPAAPTITTTALIGAVAGVLVVFTIRLLEKMKIDDPIGVISANGVAGIWGLLAVACTGEFNSLKLLHGISWPWYHQLLIQALGICVIFAWVFAVSFAILLLIRMIMGLRVGSVNEIKGLDKIDCGMVAYPEFNITKMRH